MTIKQLSVFVENRRGKLADIIELLGSHDINIRAITLADTNEFGLVRMIVSNPDGAVDILRGAGMMVRTSDAIAVGVLDKPGEFAKAIRLIANAGVSVDYLFTLASPKEGEAVIIVRMDQPGEGVSALKKGGFHILEAKDLIL